MAKGKNEPIGRRQAARDLVRKIKAEYYFAGEGQNPVPWEEILQAGEQAGLPEIILVEACRRASVPVLRPSASPPAKVFPKREPVIASGPRPVRTPVK